MQNRVSDRVSETWEGRGIDERGVGRSGRKAGSGERKEFGALKGGGKEGKG